MNMMLEDSGRMHLSFAPLSEVGFGAEVLGLDPSRPLTDEIAEALRQALWRFKVLTLRGHSLDPTAFKNYAAAFGEYEPFFISEYNLPSHPEIYVLSNVRKDGKPVGRDGAGTHWHTDHTFHEKPASVTLLHAVQVPDEGGDTLFVDTVEAYRSLPDDLKRCVDGRRAIHRYQKKEFVFSGERDLSPEQQRRIEDLKALRAQEERNLAPSPTAKKSNTVPDRLHPIVRTHPVTGVRALYLNDEMTIGVEGVGENEGRDLLSTLCRHATRPEAVLRYVWRPGDVVAWDNAATIHAATYTPPEQPRTLHRITIKGTVPF